MRQRTIAESRPTRPTQSQTSASLPATSPPTTEDVNATLPSQTSTNEATDAPAQQDCQRPPKVSARSLADQRPAPPSTPVTNEPDTDTPGTGALSTHSPPPSVQIGINQQRLPEHEQPTVDKETPAENTVDSPTESSDTLVTGTVVVNSPAPACESVQDADLFAADIPTLQDWQRVASENVATLTTRLARARDNLWRITKRLKTMQDGKEPDTPPASPFADIVMEIID